MTIYDIAKEAKTSPASVSRYLNKIKIREATKERIEAVLKKYDFTPNQIARGLASNSIKTIGIILIDIRLPHYSHTAYALEKEFRQTGYNIIICNTHGDLDETISCVKSLLSYHVDGIAFFGSVFSKLNENLELLNLLNDLPVITLNCHLSLPNSYSLVVDDGYGIELGVEYLYKKNKKNLFLVYDSDTPSSLARIEAFKVSMKRYSLDYTNRIIKVNPGLDGGYNAVDIILNSDLPCDGIMCTEDLLAVGVINHLNEKNIKVGVEVSVIGFNNSNYSRITIPSMTSIDTLSEYQASIVAHMLENLISHNEPVSSCTYRPVLVERQSA